MTTEGYVQVPEDSTGKKLRTRVNTIGANEVHSEVVAVEDVNGNILSPATETTLSGIKSQTDKLTFDSSNRLAIQNPPNMDIALSTRASETTLSSFVGTPDSSPPSKGIVLLGYDGSLVRRVKVTSDGKLLCQLG
jgi:hypothetical protein